MNDRTCRRGWVFVALLGTLGPVAPAAAETITAATGAVNGSVTDSTMTGPRILRIGARVNW